MRTTMKAWVVAVAGVAMVATAASGADYQSDMREMRELVMELQDQVQAQQQQIDTQQTVMQDAGLEDERGSSSKLSSFLESTDFSGWVAASYFYNTNNPGSSHAGPAVESPFSNPFHPEHNTFQFDEAWFSMERAATSESPAGFAIDLVYGATAGVNNGSGGGGNVDSNEIWVGQANVSYMTPWGPSVTAGKFYTTIGYEVAGAPSNVNITRGFMYNLAQPISHIGATVSQDLDSGLTYTFGIVNGFSEEQPDTNHGKGFLWQLGWGNDEATALFNGYYAEKSEDFLLVGATFDDHYVLDLVVEWTPADDLLLWADLTHATAEVANGGAEPTISGIALGGRMGVTDRLGLGGRFEYAKVDLDIGGDDESDLWSVTGTSDFALTDNLTWKLEAKWETANDAFDNAYAESGANNEDYAVYLGTQIYYEF